MTRFAIGEQVIIRFGNHQGQKARVINNQLADIYRVKSEDGFVLFYSGKGLAKETEDIRPVTGCKQ
jgi:hypothetical protein